MVPQINKFLQVLVTIWSSRRYKKPLNNTLQVLVLFIASEFLPLNSMYQVKFKKDKHRTYMKHYSSATRLAQGNWSRITSISGPEKTKTE